MIREDKELVGQLLLQHVDHLEKTIKHITESGESKDYCMGEDAVSGSEIIKQYKATIIQCKRLLAANLPRNLKVATAKCWCGRESACSVNLCSVHLAEHG